MHMPTSSHQDTYMEVSDSFSNSFGSYNIMKAPRKMVTAVAALHDLTPFRLGPELLFSEPIGVYSR
jgi:hypothetical protein